MEYNKKNLVFLVLFLFVVSFCSFFLFGAPRDFPISKIFTIKQGSSLRSLSKDLQDEHFIKSRVVFESMVIIYGGEKKVAPGDYLFDKKLNVFSIASRIASINRGISQVKITIPEGYDTLQIADTFSKKLQYFNATLFLETVSDREGYLFPDTYFFFPTANTSDVIKVLSDNFINKIKPLENEIRFSGNSENTIITMASIVEREAHGDEDRAIISGILWNRLNKKMPLQVDAAPETYKNKGLPKNPICNPGIEAIYASLHPTSSVYLFYLHDKQGGIHYAKTFTEHKQNIKKYLK